jgi:hypothetical protein
MTSRRYEPVDSPVLPGTITVFFSFFPQLDERSKEHVFRNALGKTYLFKCRAKEENFNVSAIIGWSL